jgi:hypothetical protein
LGGILGSSLSPFSKEGIFFPSPVFRKESIKEGWVLIFLENKLNKILLRSGSWKPMKNNISGFQLFTQ